MKDLSLALLIALGAAVVVFFGTLSYFRKREVKWSLVTGFTIAAFVGVLLIYLLTELD